MGRERPVRAAPRFELWNLQLPPEVREIQFLQLGSQAATAKEAGAGAAALLPLLSLEDGPNELNRGIFVDDQGASNVTYIAYWFDPQVYSRWASSQPVMQFWATRPLRGGVGFWQESARVPVDLIDTLYTTHDPVKFDQTGIAQHGSMSVCKMHDYWGAVRDRLPGAEQGGLLPDFCSYVPASGETRGQRIRVTAPANVCMARHHEDWRNAPMFGELYTTNVAGVKEAGTKHLAHHPELGCITARAIEGQALDGSPIGRADAVTWFLSLENLLDWARSDPSHLAIYAAFFKVATEVKEGEVWDVPMWHEVFVVPKGNTTAEYVNCHNRTGFLTLGEHPVFAAQQKAKTAA